MLVLAHVGPVPVEEILPYLGPLSFVALAGLAGAARDRVWRFRRCLGRCRTDQERR